MTAGATRDREAIRAGIARWLGERRPRPALEVAPVTKPSVGFSSETFFVEVTWTEGKTRDEESLVVRLPPAGPGLFPEYDLDLQARLHEVLASTGLPVPVPIAYEADSRWLGDPFLLMPRVPGRTVPDRPPYTVEGWLHDASPEEQSRLHAGFLDVLADLHAVDWQGCRLGFVQPEGTHHLAAHVARWERYLDWSTEGRQPAALADALAWCRENLPAADPPPSVLWGDPRLANVVFDEDLRPAALLDWELATIGPAEMDLAWFLELHHGMAERTGGDLPGFPGRAATIARYQRRLGRPVGDLRWFAVFAWARSLSILFRVQRLSASAAAGSPAERFPMSERLRELMAGRARGGGGAKRPVD